MRIWRDIPSEDELRRADLRERRILDAVKQYHLVKKDRLVNIFPRIAKLLEVIRVGKKLAGNKPMDARLKSLLHRAAAKIEYLRVLEQYYNVQHPDEIKNPATLDMLLQGAQQTAQGGKLLGLAPSVLLEKMDPLHRDWELGGVNQKDQHVHEWQTAVRHGGYNEPFLIYLEATSHCLNAAEAKDTDTVTYFDVETAKHTPVFFLCATEGKLWQWRHDVNTFELFDTTWVTKRISAKGGFWKALAYNFTSQKELVADLHNPNEGRNWTRFHHSSFTSGSLVRCAGMIGGADGKIKHIDNDSGHYKPPVENLTRLVKHLNKKGVFAADAKVENAKTREAVAVTNFLGNG
jgi:hypothetical protein